MWLRSAVFVFVLQMILAYAGTPDTNMEVIDKKMTDITSENCHTKLSYEQRLVSDSVAQVPTYYKLMQHVTYANRSKLLHLHNTAMSRGLYFSFLYAALNQSKYFADQPELVHLYMKASADMSANQGWIDGSALMFDERCFYPNFMRMVSFNSTLYLFGVRSFKDGNGNTKLAREPINATNQELISGTALKDDIERNYINERYKYCPYTSYNVDNPGDFWWPDTRGYKDSLRKRTYSAGVKYSNATGQFKTTGFESIPFFGVSLPGATDVDITLPVLMTVPYFDCGRSNKWIVSMTSPVVDYMTRYTAYTHIRRPRFTAVAAMDMEFEKIDINPCPVSMGNEYPNAFAGTAQCSHTTECEPLSGFGFRRGGYQCACKPGLYYPWGQDGPFQGVDIEAASEEARNNGTFDCLSAEELENYNGTDTVAPAQKKVFETLVEDKWPTAQAVIQKAQSVPESCDTPVPLLSTGTIPGASEQFEAQGRTALAISHFLSNFLQNSWALHDVLYANDEYPKRPFEHYLKEIHVFAEVLAPLMGDMKLSGVGVYFDRNKFATSDGVSKELFAPYAYKIRNKLDETDFRYLAIDLAGKGTYPDEDWFVKMKDEWKNSAEKLSRFSDSSAVHDDAAITFRAPQYTDGKWSEPMYKCDNMLTDWVLTYRVPFFGPVSSGTGLEFKGVVAVDVDLKHLDINQCPTEDSDNDVFSNTAKCHFDSQYCVAVPGRRFRFGSYTCVFRQGYALPTNFSLLHYLRTDQGGSFHGDAMENEHAKKERNETHKYDYMKGEEIKISSKTTTTRPVGGAGGLSIESVVVRVGIYVLTIILYTLT